MAIRKLHAVHALNRYLWARIEAEGVMVKIPYQGVQLTPIVPVEETPELITAIEAQSGMGTMPFIVYNWSKTDSGQLWMVETQEIAYAVRSGNDTTMRQIINLFDEEFKDYDEAAQRVNAYLRSTLAPTSELRDYHFHSINISVLGGQMPTDTEDGMNESLISLRVLLSGPQRY